MNGLFDEKTRNRFYQVATPLVTKEQFRTEIGRAKLTASFQKMVQKVGKKEKKKEEANNLLNPL